MITINYVISIKLSNYKKNENQPLRKLHKVKKIIEIIMNERIRVSPSPVIHWKCKIEKKEKLKRKIMIIERICVDRQIRICVDRLNLLKLNLRS